MTALHKMSPVECLRWAIAPLQRRSLVLFWGGLGLFVASGGISVLFAVPVVIMLPLHAGMLVGWLAAAAGMVGTVRRLFGHAFAEMRKAQAERLKDE